MSSGVSEPRPGGLAAGDGAPGPAADAVAAHRGADVGGRGGPRARPDPRERELPPAPAAGRRPAGRRGGGVDPWRSGQALPVRRRPCPGRPRRTPASAPAYFQRSPTSCVRRRSRSIHPAARQSSTDAELWVDPDDWADCPAPGYRRDDRCTAARQAATPEGAVHISATVAMFVMDDDAPTTAPTSARPSEPTRERPRGAAAPPVRRPGDRAHHLGARQRARTHRPRLRGPRPDRLRHRPRPRARRTQRSRRSCSSCSAASRRPAARGTWCSLVVQHGQRRNAGAGRGPAAHRPRVDRRPGRYPGGQRRVVGVHLPGRAGLPPQTVPASDAAACQRRCSGWRRRQRWSAAPRWAASSSPWSDPAGASPLDAVSYSSPPLLRRDPAARGPTACASSNMIVELREGWTAFRSRTWLWVIVLAFASSTPCTPPAGTPSGRSSPTTPSAGRAGVSCSARETAGMFLGRSRAVARPVPPAAVHRHDRRHLLRSPLMFRPRLPSRPSCCSSSLPSPPEHRIELFGIGWDLSMQQHVPPHLLSRVYAYDALGSLVAIPIGQMLAGPLAAAVGVQAGSRAVRCSLVMVAGGLAIAVPAVRRLERTDLPDAGATAESAGREPRTTSSCSVPVGRDRAAPGGTVRAVEVGEPAAGLGDDDRRRGQVVQRAPPARRRCRRRPRPPACRTRSRRRRGSRHTSRVSPRNASSRPRSCQPERLEYDSDASSRPGHARDRHPAGRRTGSCRSRRRTRCPPTSAGPARGGDEPGHDVVAVHQRDQGGPDRHPADEVLGAVDRVEHPAPRPVTGVEPNSSPVTASRGRARDRIDRIDSSVDLSASETGVRSGFVSTHKVEGPEARHRDRVGCVGEDVRQSEVVVVRRHVTNRTSPFRALQSPPHTSDQETLEDLPQDRGDRWDFSTAAPGTA